MLEQVLSLSGAAMVLGAYSANLYGRLPNKGVAYAALNTLGSGLLSWVALQGTALGLIAIEVVWTAISAVALLRALRAPRAGSA